MPSLPFRILAPGVEPILTESPVFTHTFHETYAADDHPYVSLDREVTMEHSCSFHVMDLTPECPHGWAYDPFSRAMARGDCQAMIAAVQAELQENRDRQQLAALGRAE